MGRQSLFPGENPGALSAPREMPAPAYLRLLVDWTTAMHGWSCAESAAIPFEIDHSNPRLGAVWSRACWGAMKKGLSTRAVFLIALLLVCAAIGRAADTKPITSLHAIHVLTNEQAGQGLPVAFEGTVTYYKEGDIDLFVQDGEVAIYVETIASLKLDLGDRVLVLGKTRASFRPEIKADNVIFLRHGTAPPAVNADFRQLIRAEFDCRRATVRGRVRSANIVSDAGVATIYLQLQMEGGEIDAEMIESKPGDLTGLLDAEVEVTGAVAGKFDNKNQMTGILVEVQSLSDVKIIKQATRAPSSLPVMPMDEILSVYNVQDRTQRVRVEGTVTYDHPGAAIVLQNGAKSLWIETQFERPVKIGTLASASGFPDVRNGALTLTQGQIEVSGNASPIIPQPVPASELAVGTHAFDLVSVEGRLLMSVREAGQDEYVLVSDGRLFSAVYRHPERGLNLPLPPMKQVGVGSRVRMTGICMLERFDKFQGPVAFEVLLRSSDDIAVVASPSPLNVRNLTLVVGLLLITILAIGARSWRAERRNRQQMGESAYFEQRRSLILESINGVCPLNEIVQQITALASFKLHGAPAWCELANGERLGNRLDRLAGLTVLETQIRARSGVQLGAIFAAFPAGSSTGNLESEALSMAAGLAALAIENRRLYSDLLHRSDYDLLTDMHNRFSLEKRLGELIEESSRNGNIFGLIYVDLDEFKQVNDLYGHRIGDLYLQKVSQRMKHQIRPKDMLARIGGDEFAVLVPAVDSQDDVMEVASRLEHCFEDLFAIDGNQLRGAASLGTAIYPLDGTTRDSLLNSADAAMYVAKHGKRRGPGDHSGDVNLEDDARSQTRRGR
jgi:diguanylate cyclase (GGDEF)-like protein